jgi:release factor glutamine methyltransferase
VNSSATGKSLWDWRRWAVELAIEHHIDRHEIDWMLQRVANLEPLTLRLESIGADEIVNLTMRLDRLSTLWLARVNDRTPVQYLLGTTTWRDFELVISPAVLIPRPETESIVDIAIERTSPTSKLGIWFDLGTGSGAIAIGLAKALPNTSIYGIDCSSEALEIAQANAIRLGIQSRITFEQSDWLSSSLFEPFRHRVAVIVSNPPYIPSSDVLELQPEVVNHEPHLALDGGLDGLNSIRELIDTGAEYLEPGGMLLMEMMLGQGDAVVDLLLKQGSYQQIEVIKDLAGIDRFVIAWRI